MFRSHQLIRKNNGKRNILPVLGAVAHAIANATGVWIKDLTITPEKILNARRRQKAAAETLSAGNA